MVEKHLSDAAIAAALDRGREADRSEPRAVAAHYDARARRVVVDLANGCSLAFPRDLVRELRDAASPDIAAVEVLAGGRALRWEALDLDLGVAPLMAGVFGTAAWMRQLRSDMGRVGGSASSEAKATAARANGRKGGRPRKTQAPRAA